MDTRLRILVSAMELFSEKGFGSTLVETTIVRSGGTIASTWQLEGLSVWITMPLSSLLH